MGGDARDEGGEVLRDVAAQLLDVDDALVLARRGGQARAGLRLGPLRGQAGVEDVDDRQRVLAQRRLVRLDLEAQSDLGHGGVDRDAVDDDVAVRHDADRLRTQAPVVEAAAAGVDEDLRDLAGDRPGRRGTHGTRGEDLRQRGRRGALARDVDDREVLVDDGGPHVLDGGDARIVDERQPAAGVQQVPGQLLVRDIEDDGVIEDRVERQADDTRVGGIRQPLLLDRGDDVPICDDGTALDPHLMSSRKHFCHRDVPSSRASTQLIAPARPGPAGACHETGTLSRLSGNGRGAGVTGIRQRPSFVRTVATVWCSSRTRSR